MLLGLFLLVARSWLSSVPDKCPSKRGDTQLKVFCSWALGQAWGSIYHTPAPGRVSRFAPVLVQPPEIRSQSRAPYRLRISRHCVDLAPDSDKMGLTMRVGNCPFCLRDGVE